MRPSPHASGLTFGTRNQAPNRNRGRVQQNEPTESPDYSNNPDPPPNWNAHGTGGGGGVQSDRSPNRNRMPDDNMFAPPPGFGPPTASQSNYGNLVPANSNPDETEQPRSQPADEDYGGGGGPGEYFGGAGGNKRQNQQDNSMNEPPPRYEYKVRP